MTDSESLGSGREWPAQRSVPLAKLGALRTSESPDQWNDRGFL